MARPHGPREGAHRHRPEPTGVESLTVRELQCLYLAARGRENYQIARELGMAHSTANHHLSAAYAKLGVNDRISAILAVLRYAMGEG